MTLLAAAVVPAAPLLVPALAGGSAGVDAALRAEVLDTVRGLVDGPGALVVVAAAPVTGPTTGTWDWSGLGVRSRGAAGGPALPPELAVGAWLLEQVAPDRPARCIGIARDAPAAACAQLGASLTGDLRLLVVGDGSARRTEKAPGHLDGRAAGFDAAVERALASGDPAALLALDVDLAAALMAAGRPAWQVLAGAALAGGALAGGGMSGGALSGGAGRSWSAELRYAGAPYGVGYLVARWSPA